MPDPQNPFDLICLTCHHTYDGAYNNIPCPKCGNAEPRWIFRRGFEKLVSDPKGTTITSVWGGGVKDVTEWPDGSVTIVKTGNVGMTEQVMTGLEQYILSQRSTEIAKVHVSLKIEI